MSTATFQAPPLQGAVMVITQNKPLRPELEQIVEDIFGLKALANTTGFMTFKSQREILARLSPQDQAAVGRALAMRAKQETK
jgi:hypothetical protein